MSFLVPNVFTPDTLADANAVNTNFTYVDNALNTLEGMIGAPITGFFVSTMKTSNTAAANAIALQADILALIAQGGGTYLLPYGKCSIAGPVYIGSPLSGPPLNVYAPIRIQGAGNNSTIIQTLATDTFQVNSTTGGGLDGTGVDFFNFRILYSAGLTSGAAIRAVSGQEIRIDKIWFDDCPVAIAADNAAQMTIFRCLGTYAQNTSPANLAMVTVGTALQGGQSAAVEVYMAASTWRTSNFGSGFGIALFGIEHFRMMNCRVEAFQQGISIIPSTVGKQAQELHFENVSVFTTSATTGVGAGFFVQPQSGQTVQRLVMIGCETHPGDASGTTYTGGGIVLDASQGGTIDQVRLVSCYSANWNGPGLRIIATNGTMENIQVQGGAYICNGSTQSGANGAGIYITSASVVSSSYYISDVQLDNASSQYSVTQKYAVAADGTASLGQIKVFNCAMTGLVTAPVVNTISTNNHFFVMGCRGYNDANTNVAGISQIPASNVQFDGTTIGTTPYYGPILVSFSGGTVTHTKISHDRAGLVAVDIGQTSGVIPIACGQSMEIDYGGGGAPTAFQVLGQ